MINRSLREGKLKEEFGDGIKESWMEKNKEKGWRGEEGVGMFM